MRSNILYFGDNLEVLQEKIPAESVDLVYADPPFNSSRNYFVIFKDRTGKDSTAQDVAFWDTWSWGEEAEIGYRDITTRCSNLLLSETVKALRTILNESGMMAYLVSMAARIFEIHRVLKPTGSFYLHCDPTASHYMKLVLDAVFGVENYRNEIIWKRTSAHNDASQGLTRYGKTHDVILFYTKSKNTIWNMQYAPYDEEYLKQHYSNIDSESGRRYKTSDLTAAKGGGDTSYEWKGVFPPKGRYWAYSKDNLKRFDEANLLSYSKSGMPRLKHYLDEMKGIVLGDNWDDIPPINSQAKERLGYPTQKPLALLRRIIEASSNPGDIVLDPYCGCGTAVSAAHELGRKWVGVDITPVAVGVIKTRLENTFSDLMGKVPVEGFPRDVEGARRLFEIDPYVFQTWACTEISMYPLMKKGADGGVDGLLNFFDLDDKPYKAVAQVKGGKVTLSQIRDFCHVTDREKAALGFFVCLGDVTKPMRDEAIKQGFWTSAGGVEYPKIQILTIEGLMSGKERPRMPIQEKRSILGHRASRQTKRGLQTALDIDL